MSEYKIRNAQTPKPTKPPPRCPNHNQSGSEGAVPTVCAWAALSSSATKEPLKKVVFAEQAQFFFLSRITNGVVFFFWKKMQ
jgi:hypothetical protein